MPYCPPTLSPLSWQPWPLGLNPLSTRRQIPPPPTPLPPTHTSLCPTTPPCTIPSPPLRLPLTRASNRDINSGWWLRHERRTNDSLGWRKEVRTSSIAQHEVASAELHAESQVGHIAVHLAVLQRGVEGGAHTMGVRSAVDVHVAACFATEEL